MGLGLANVFGSRTGVATATADGYRLTVTHPSVTRSSLPVQWELTLRHPGGFRGPVRVAVNISYYQMFDFNNLYPLPNATLNRDGTVLMSFSPPIGDTFTLLMDAATQPGLRSGQPATVAIVGPGEVPIVQVRYETRVMP